MRAAISAGTANFIILILCELSVQSVGLNANIIILHGISLGVALTCISIVELTIWNVKKKRKIQNESEIDRKKQQNDVISRELLRLWWWPVITLLFPAILFRIMTDVLSWEHSAMPYGYFAAIYLTFRSLQAW